MKWVIIGSAGQLGAELLDLMTDSAVGLPRDMGDLTNPLQLERNLLAEKPDGVINCAAFNHVDKAEDSPDEAFANNSWGVKDLAIICDKYNWKFVQFSTDHVFSGSKSAPWVETDLAVPANAYGLSKYSGEMWAQKMNTNTYIVRTCGLYGDKGRGGKGGNFVSTIQKLAKAGKPLRVVADQVCNPSNARDVAEATIHLINRFDPGVYHLANTGSCSWHDFALAILHFSEISVPVIPISTREFGARAKRPACSVLGSVWAGSTEYPVLRHWRESLAEYLKIR